MTKESLNSPENQPSKNTNKTKKIILRWLLATLIAWGLIWWAAAVDINKAKKRRNADLSLYWEFNIEKGKQANIITRPGLDWWPDPDTIHTELDTILSHNEDIITIDATTLESIMLWEESLKTTKNWISKYDEKLEKSWIDRNPYSKSFIGKILGKIKEWSYGPYQVQPEAIDKYKDNPELYNILCERIAKFRLPDINWEYTPLHEQLWLTIEEMIKQIQNHEIYTFAWGERFLAAYGIVLIDEISRESHSMIDSYNGTDGYKRWIKNTKSLEDMRNNKWKLIYPELTHWDNDLMSPYILRNRWEVSYKRIWQLFNSDAFINWMVASYWCMDYINNVKNSNYLYLLSLMELNEWFKNQTWDLNIVMPTWNFWPTTLNLVNKHFNKNFKDWAEAKKFLDELPTEELQKLRDEALNNFEQNMRLLYTLNWDKHWINDIQSKYLSECLDLTFNHIYAWVNIFSDFLQQNCWDKSDSLNKLRNSFVKEQNKNSLEEIKKIMTNENSFISFTGLDNTSYLKWIKYYLCPTLLGTSDWLYQIWWIIPVIQDNPWWTKMSNEQNSLSRFAIWVHQHNIDQIDREMWIKYVLQPWDTNIDSLRHIMRDQKSVREYLQTCRTINGDSISSPEDIPYELMFEMIRWNDWFYPLFENGERFYEGDTIRIKIDGLNLVYRIFEIDKPATKEVPIQKTIKTKKWKKKTVTTNKTIKLCTVNSDGTLTMQKWWTFQDVLYFYCQNDTLFKKRIESIAWNPINQPSDITQDVIKRVIIHPDWTPRGIINKVNNGQRFGIVFPFN